MEAPVKECFCTKSCSELLDSFEKERDIIESGILAFSGVDGHDVYNISQPFEIGGEIVIAGRVEKRKDWAKSNVLFFEKGKNSWKLIDGSPVLPLEDAFATSFGDEVVMGGVEVYTIDNEYESKDIGYRTVFYRGRDLNSLERFAHGPEKMKDIRLVPLKEGGIGVLTRPQGGNFGKGMIGSVQIQSLNELKQEKILEAKIMEGLFRENEWGGANELHVLEDGRIGIIGHIACEDENHFKHYYAISFIYDPFSHNMSTVKIIATRKDFPRGEAKRPELEDVVFPGGMVRHNNGYATLYAGLSDAQAGYVVLKDPFC